MHNSIRNLDIIRIAGIMRIAGIICGRVLLGEIW